MVVLLREAGKVIPEIFTFGFGATTAGVVLVWAFYESLELTSRAAGADLDGLTKLGGMLAGLGCEVGFRYLKKKKKKENLC